METRAHHIFIGTFALLVLSAAMLFGLWLAKGPTGGRFRQFDVVFSEPVYGLSEGSSVQYSGVNIGDVITLTLDAADPRKVHALIRVGENTPVRRDTEARLAMTGITGTSVIQLTGGSPQSPPLTAPDGETPVIVASRSALAAFAAGGEDLFGSLSAVLHAARKILSPENTVRIDRTLADVEQVADALARERGDMHAMLSTMTATARDADQVMRSANRLIEQGNVLASRHGEEVLANTQQMSASLAKASASLDALIEANRASVDAGLGAADQLGPTLAELRATLASLRAVTERLQDDPSAYLLGRDRLRDFSP